MFNSERKSHAGWLNSNWVKTSVFACLIAMLSSCICACGSRIPFSGITFTTVASSSNPSTYSAEVTFTATMDPAAAGGDVTFKDGTTTLGTVTLSDGTATFSTSELNAGVHNITAVYEGSGRFNKSTSPQLTQVVGRSDSVIALVSSLNPSAFQNTVTLSITVTPPTATGTVKFYDGTALLGTTSLSSGAASWSTSVLIVGDHAITVDYEGDSNCKPATSSELIQKVERAESTTTLASSLNPSTFEASVIFTATVTPSAASGTVTFKDGTTTLGTETISGGTAVFNTSALSVGTHEITAEYGGDTNYKTSSSTALAQIVNKADTTIAIDSAPNPSLFGGLVTLTATVTITTTTTTAATGTVTFKEGATTLGTGPLGGGTATFNTSALTGGIHNLMAEYGGDTNYNSSTSTSVEQVVNKPPVFTSAISTPFPNDVANSFTVVSTGYPTPAITLTSGSLPTGVDFTPNTDGTATLTGSIPYGSIGSSALTFTATNGVAPNSDQSFTLNIIPPIKNITGGTYWMGCVPGDADCHTWENPRHLVTAVPSFKLMKYEVTQTEYLTIAGTNPSDLTVSCNIECPTGCPDDCPVQMVDWVNAKAFCTAIGGRFPTEAEWEYAVRANADPYTKWYCGNDSGCVTNVAWDFYNSDLKTHQKGLKEPNAFGFYDIYGNVWEWVEDDYHTTYDGAPTDGSAWINTPTRDNSRVLRGDNYTDGHTWFMRSSGRGYATWNDESNTIGIRCAWDAN